ncbi:MAG: hypothetical protein Q9169_001489 [Polycauliona sp. 2 TL-2023]
MPITVKPASHGANSMNSGFFVQDPLQLLKHACPEESKRCQELLQSSFGPELQASLGASRNGFVQGAIDAYNRHHHLRIRPEDVWFAILSQFSLYINAHAEELRGLFVAHAGKKELKLTYDGNRHTFDFAVFAKEMGELIEQNVVDPELRRWMMPAFSTTTKQDIIVASILLMGSCQKYFDFGCCLMCGLPSVTLLGEKADWELLLTRLEKLKDYGEEPTQFYTMLKPVVSRFVGSFDNPTGSDIIDFWQRMADKICQGSGPSYYSGWITAFCFWDEDGKSMVRPNRQQSALRLDDAAYHLIDTSSVPPGYTSVPVKLDDNGQVFEARMVAGSLAQNYTIGSSDEGSGLNTIQPESGWYMFTGDSEPAAEFAGY